MKIIFPSLQIRSWNQSVLCLHRKSLHRAALISSLLLNPGSVRMFLFYTNHLGTLYIFLGLEHHGPRIPSLLSCVFSGASSSANCWPGEEDSLLKCTAGFCRMDHRRKWGGTCIHHPLHLVEQIVCRGKLDWLFIPIPEHDRDFAPRLTSNLGKRWFSNIHPPEFQINMLSRREYILS